MGLPTKFAFWFARRGPKIVYFLARYGWWVTFLASLSASLFLSKIYGAGMWLIFGGSMIAATFVPAILVMIGSYAPKWYMNGNTKTQTPRELRGLFFIAKRNTVKRLGT